MQCIIYFPNIQIKNFVQYFYSRSFYTLISHQKLSTSASCEDTYFHSKRNVLVILQVVTVPILCDDAVPVLEYNFHNERLSLIRNGFKTLKTKQR